MSFTPNNQLIDNSNTWLKNSATAMRLFVDDQFRLAPKSKFLFHVSFGINQAALKSIDLLQRHRTEINMLVKSVDLPKFTMTTDTLNQYNRKKIIQLQHKFENINLKFHDDNSGIINQLWQNYYSYYYADSTAASTGGAYLRNATKSSSFITSNYGMDNGSTAPFFTYIKIYQMARHEYVSYTLINPVITSWNHNNLSYSMPEFHDFDMSIAYEAVSYDTGKVSPETVEGFGGEHYDLTPSPLQPGINTSFNTGTQPTASPSFANSQPSLTQGEAINVITQQVNTYENTQIKPLPTAGILNNVLQSPSQGVGGLQQISFPTATTPSIGAVQATPINLGI